MTTLFDGIALLLIVAGLFFLLVGAIGFMRLPDVFCRLHVTGVLDTLGAPLIMVGAAIYIGAELVSLKLLLATLFLSVTSPLVGHLLARAALEAGHQPGVIEDSARFEAVPERRAAAVEKAQADRGQGRHR
jgi:multicomponent Na+:H+ antiporter subunit G